MTVSQTFKMVLLFAINVGELFEIPYICTDPFTKEKLSDSKLNYPANYQGLIRLTKRNKNRITHTCRLFVIT